MLLLIVNPSIMVLVQGLVFILFFLVFLSPDIFGSYKNYLRLPFSKKPRIECKFFVLEKSLPD